MAPPLLLVLLLLVSVSSDSAIAHQQANDEAFISAVISEKGIGFAKDVLVEQAIEFLTPLQLPDIEKSVHIPLIGTVHMVASNITLHGVNVSSSAVRIVDSAFAIVASGATAYLSMDWSYSYSTWLITISDRGNASVQVEGMEVELTMSVTNQNGVLELTVLECGCNIEDLDITVTGGASWFYQGFVDAFHNHIRTAVENAITRRITEGVSKLDELLQKIPKKINVDKFVALNVTLVNGPLYGNSSVEFDVNGLFILLDKVPELNYLLNHPHFSLGCGGASKMLLISFDEVVFNSASAVLFQVGLMHWIVDKLPDNSILNTASWKSLIPQLYSTYPNDDMSLNISLTSSPAVRITEEKIGTTIYLDTIVNVLVGAEIVPVASISGVVTVSGIVEVSENNLAGKAELDALSLTLKWSEVGSLNISSIQAVVLDFLNNIIVPFVNSHLNRGFPFPIIHGFTLQDAYIFTSDSRIFVCSDVVNTSPILSLLVNSPFQYL
uniref:BPI/LBP family protein At1g04970 n=1 Tax=Ananas comosus var. bracteatus TaxID=296719 RepID=A0A6V7QS88_ANACO